ncbi:GyrI-like domain-containing protein [Paenibacillus sp. FSL W8-0187]|uniref:GyrI-like domain-containing protein n=1 Tax=unclassified Paenibacillus TaxID=185978 RepID=UPI0030DA95C5
MSDSNQNQSERFIEVRPAMSIQGVGVRTTNEAEAGPQGKIPQLWDRYFQSGLQAQISDKDQAIYALYTDYESDASGEYTLIIGNRIEEDVAAAASSEELEQASVPAAKYMVFRTRRGPLMEIVPEVWYEIWSYFQQSAEKRTYTGDYERYDMQQFDPAHTMVDVYIAIE